MLQTTMNSKVQLLWIAVLFMCIASFTANVADEASVDGDNAQTDDLDKRDSDASARSTVPSTEEFNKRDYTTERLGLGGVAAHPRDCPEYNNGRPKLPNQHRIRYLREQAIIQAEKAMKAFELAFLKTDFEYSRTIREFKMMIEGLETFL